MPIGVGVKAEIAVWTHILADSGLANRAWWCGGQREREVVGVEQIGELTLQCRWRHREGVRVTVVCKGEWMRSSLYLYEGKHGVRAFLTLKSENRSAPPCDNVRINE